MYKKVLLTCLILLNAACGGYDYSSRICPMVTIPRDTSYVTQIVSYADNFKIELTGFDGHCFFDEGPKRTYGIITPHFEIRRLRKSDETRVDFTFYTETIKGPPAYLGKKTYSASVIIAEDEKVKEFDGPTIRVKLPPEDFKNFEILLGIDLSRTEKEYNRQSFDTLGRYDDGQRVRYIERTVIEDYSEHGEKSDYFIRTYDHPNTEDGDYGDDEPADGAESHGVYRPKPESGCSTCGL